MKFLPILAAVAVGLAAGWWARGRNAGPTAPSHAAHSGSDPAAGQRKLRFYQSPMHPWITSPEPGLCTICGMKLVPVYEGEAGFDSAEGVLSLGSNSVTAVGIATAPADVRRLTRTLRVAGTLDDDDSRHRVVSARVEGRIESVTVHNEGAEIREGTELATIYSPTLLAAAREYAALATSGDDSGPLLTAARTRLRQLGLADAQIQSLPSTVGPDTRTLPWLAPMSGTIVKRSIYAGQWVREGDPLYEIADFTTMWFKADLYERDLPWVRTSQEVVVTLPSRPGEAFTNRVAFIDPNFNDMTRSTRLRVEIPNPADPATGIRRFQHRVYAEARIHVVSEPVLALPRSAVLNPGGAPSAWVELAPGNYQNRPLQLGRAGDDAWEILAGVEPGERVVTQGGLLLDAQSQLRGGITPATPTNTPPATKADAPAWKPSSPAASRLAADALRAAATVGAALAKDDLKAYHDARPRWGAALDSLAKSDSPPPAAWLVRLPEAKDLPAARKAFHEAILPWTPLALESRKSPGLESLKVYRCPMTSRSFPGAPPKAVWWQVEGPLRNPWFGADMLDCGTELP